MLVQSAVIGRIRTSYLGPPFFSGTIIPKYIYIPWPVGVVVLTDNTSKYKEFSVTLTRKHYIRPLVMKIHVIIIIIIIKLSLQVTTTRFYDFINGKIKNEPEKLELDISVAKKPAIPRFSTANGEFCGVKIALRGLKLVLLLLAVDSPYALQLCWRR